LKFGINKYHRKQESIVYPLTLFCLQVTSPEDDELETTLKFLSNKYKTVIITIINNLHTEEEGLLDLFLRGLRGGKETDHIIDRILFVAADQVAFNRCTEMRLNCYKLCMSSQDLSRGVVNKKDGFVDNMWIKSYFLRTVLKCGYSFIFTVRHGHKKFKFQQKIVNMIETLKKKVCQEVFILIVTIKTIKGAWIKCPIQYPY
jgi:Nucleotide-diphospho-sugar transferase